MFEFYELHFFSCFMLVSTARVILRRAVYGWSNQCILVGQDSAPKSTEHQQVTTNFPACGTLALRG